MASAKQFGEKVALDVPCTFPEHTAITGTRTRLAPLHPDHAEEFYEAVGGKENEALWDYMGHGPFEDIVRTRTDERLRDS